MKSILLRAALLLAVAPAAVPASFSLRYPDADASHKAALLTADRAGNLFVVSTVARTSTITKHSRDED